MRIGIIGTGRVGCAFALALANRGIEISGACNRTRETVDFLRSKLGHGFMNDIVKVVESAELVLLTVPDSSIAGIADLIAAKCTVDAIKDKAFLHCSGALPSSILAPLSEAGAFIGSLHPVQTFADRENGWEKLSGIYFGYEGSSLARERAEKLVAILNGVMLDIKPEAKSLYHAAACVLSNYMVTLSYASGILLEHAGIGKDMGIKAFMPLLRNTVENIGTLGSESALTGPIARGDVQTVSGHIRAMEALGREVLELYKVLGRMTVELALDKGSIGQKEADALLDKFV